ncbi:MAG: PaaI family thioesterase [Actinobacteria bacterium]|nr:PaaI family thioesterase [Actinomycetota bacterium]
MTLSMSSPGPGSAPGPWQEPVRGGHPDERHLALTGAGQLRAMLTGDAPAPPMARLIGVRLIDAAPGTATFELPLSPWLRGPDGRATSGLLTMPVDAAMACAIMTGLPPHVGLTTTELTLRQVRPAPIDGRLLARGHVIHPDGPLALADVSLRDEAGALIAHGSSTCLIIDGGSAEETVSAPATGSEDPWQREAPAWEPGDDAPPPLERLTGLHGVMARNGEATYALPATGWLCAPPPGRVQGGAVAMLAEAAMTAAARTAAPHGIVFSPVELKLNYLRPLSADGREAHARARVVNAGRRFIVVGVEVRDADQRLIAVASGSAMAGAG